MARAEDGGGPGEPGGVGAEPFEAGDEAAAAAGRFRARSSSAELSTGSSSLSCTLASSSTDSYGLPPVTAQTSRQNGASACSPSVARVRPAAASGVRARRVVNERALAVTAAEVAGALADGLAGPAGDHDEYGQFVQALGERGEPVQGLLVGPVRVVDEQDERPVQPGEPGDGLDEAVADALRIGWRPPGSAMPRAGPAMSYQSPRVLAGLVRGEVRRGRAAATGVRR